MSLSDPMTYAEKEYKRLRKNNQELLDRVDELQRHIDALWELIRQLRELNVPEVYTTITNWYRGLSEKK